MTGLANQRMLFSGLALAILLALILCGPGLFYSLSLRLAPYTGASYALYLDNGAVLYGQVSGIGWRYLTLKNVWSFQSITVGEETTNNLVPQTANSLTRPDNFLMVNRSHILFLEQIGQDAKILKLGVREP